jgi:hypothetical protein
MPLDPRLIQIGVAELPAMIDFLKSAFRRRHPGDPEPSSEDVIAAYEQAFASSLAKDDLWLAAHPVAPPGSA